MTTAEQSTETMNNRISDLMWKFVFSPRLRRSFCNLSEAHTQKPKPCRYHSNDSRSMGDAMSDSQLVHSDRCSVPTSPMICFMYCPS